jgi:hypothetical protein
MDGESGLEVAESCGMCRIESSPRCGNYRVVNGGSLRGRGLYVPRDAETPEIVLWDIIIMEHQEPQSTIGKRRQ